MEFYTTVDVALSADKIQRYVKMNSLHDLCPSVKKVYAREGNRALIECIFGNHHVHRENIQQGVRFSFTDDSYALQWTITAAEPLADSVFIHFTVNCVDCEADFIELINKFLHDWGKGLKAWEMNQQEQQKHKSKACMSCGETFGGFG